MDIKRIGIVIAAILLVTVFWFVAKGWMNVPNRFDNWTGIIVASMMLSLAAAAMSLAFLLLARGGYWVAYVIAGALMTYIIVFGINLVLLTGIALAAVYWWLSAHRIGRELGERKALRISSVIMHGLPKILLGLYVLISFAFYLTPASQITQKDATAAFQKQLNNSYDLVLQSELDKLPPSQREQVKNQISGQAATTFRNILAFKFCLGTTCTPSLLDMLPPLYAFLFFLTLYSFGFIFRELADWTAVGIFSILKNSRLVAIEQADAKVDLLRL